jgi:hypothetical protein
MTAEPGKSAGTPIRIRYIESGDYFVEGSEQLPSTPVSISRWQIGFIIVVVVLMPVLMLLQQGLHERTFNWKTFAISLLPVLFVAGFAVLLFFVFRKPRLLFGQNYYRKSYRKQIGRDETNVVAEFGQDALFISGEGGVATHIPWNTIPRAIERPKGLLVYESDTVFRWFPKSAFASEHDYAAAVELLRTKVVKFERMI